MKTTIQEQPQVFKPCKIIIEVESLNELKMLWSAFNRSPSDLVKDANTNNYYIDETYTSQLGNSMYEAWDKIDNLLRELGGRKY